MSEVLLINPKKRRRRKTTKRATTARRRRPSTRRRKTVRRRRTPLRAKLASRVSRRAASTKRSTTAMARKRRSYRKNPTRRRTTRRVVRRAARRARASIGGLNFKSALKDLIPAQIGMFASKYAVRRFGEGGTETDPESWQAMHYVKGGIGALAAGFLANMVKPGTGQKVLEGGLNYVVFKLIENELISQSDWASGQFGYGENYNYRPGDVETNESGQPFLLGADNQWHALPESIGQLEPVGPLGQLEPVGPLGEDDNARYRNALLNA